MGNRNSPRRKRETLLATHVEVMYGDEPGPTWVWNPQPEAAAYAALTGFEAACGLLLNVGEHPDAVHMHHWVDRGTLCALVTLRAQGEAE